MIACWPQDEMIDISSIGKQGRRTIQGGFSLTLHFDKITFQTQQANAQNKTATTKNTFTTPQHTIASN